MASTRNKKKLTLGNLDFVKTTRNYQDSKLNSIPPLKEDKNDKDVHPAINVILNIGRVLTLLAILCLNHFYTLLQVTKTGYSRLRQQHILYLHQRLSKALLMTLAFLFSHTPVNSDVTVSTARGTYFQNEGPGRYLQGYLNESFVVSTLFECQIKCGTLHSICRSLNYIENEDGSNICEINNEAQYCALPGAFIVKRNSFYIETILEKDYAGWCSACEHRGRIKKTKEIPGFICLCQEGFYGDQCQHQVIDDLGSLDIFHDKPHYLTNLKSWLPKYSISHLCYQATQHGWGSETFHSRCDHKIPTVTIVRVGQYIFGGFSDVPWTAGAAGYTYSSNAFLFSLRNKDNLQPFNSLLYRYNQYAIYRYYEYGPTFGGGHDLHISNNANSKTGSYTNFGYTYQAPLNYTFGAANTRVLLAGSFFFTPSEVEVFHLQ